MLLASVEDMECRPRNSSETVKSSATQRMNTVICSTFEQSFVSSTITAKKGELRTSSKVLRRKLCAINSSISFWFSGAMCFRADFSNQCRTGAESSPRRRSSWIKFDESPLPWPRKARPCRARKRILDSRCSIFLASNFCSAWLALNSSPMSLVTRGNFKTSSTASECASDLACFLKEAVASFQLENPVET